jgi:hypothetical protein
MEFFIFLFFILGLLGFFANKLNRNWAGYILLALLITPLLTFLLLLILGKYEEKPAVTKSIETPYIGQID